MVGQTGIIWILVKDLSRCQEQGGRRVETRKAPPNKDLLGHKLGILKARDELREGGNLARLRSEGLMVEVWGSRG